MELFDVVFNKGSIYDMLFLDIKAVLQQPTLEILKNDNEIMYENWNVISHQKYNIALETSSEDDVYQKYAVYYPEYTKATICRPI